MHEEVSNKKTHKQTKPKQAEMSFWEHLEELRAHIFRSLAAILVAAIAIFLAKKFVFDHIILWPKDESFITNRLLCKAGDLLNIEALCIGNLNLSMQNINMSGQFMTHMYVAIIGGLIVAAPYVIWELWRFIMPALNPGEKKYSRGAVLVSSLLFILGVLFAYLLIVPLTINFLVT